MAEITNLGKLSRLWISAAVKDENIVELHISMDDSSKVQCIESCGYIEYEAFSLVDRYFGVV